MSDDILKNQDVVTIDVDVEQSAIEELITEVDAQDDDVLEYNADAPVLIDIEVDEFGGASTATKIVTTHTMSGPNQHTIGAITGLREELDDIKKLQTIYSNGKYHANYFMWHETAERPANSVGLFVTMCDSIDKIRVCTPTDDVFGVTVPTAAFIGGQDDVARDHSYGLVINAGLAAVQCESDVEVGNYIVPNDRGQAKKSNGNHGYLVTSLNVLDGVQYAVISLAAPSTIAKNISDNVDVLNANMRNALQDISSVANVANSAYALAQSTKEKAFADIEDLKGTSEDLEVKTDDTNVRVDDLTEVVDKILPSIESIRNIANDAVSSAESIRAQAVTVANDAFAAAKVNGANLDAYQTIVANVDRYAVGEYSQAYGLTWQQAKDILEVDMVYIPIEGNGVDEHTETYTDTEDDYTQRFIRGCYYTWTGNLWLESNANAVLFVLSGVAIGGSIMSPYMVIQNEDAVDADGRIYQKDTLYIWQYNDESKAYGWVPVTSISKNVLSRSVALIRHDTNRIALEVTNVAQSYAGVEARLAETESAVESSAQWSKGTSEDGEKLYNITAVKQEADGDGSSLSLVVADIEGNKVLNGASIVLAQKEGEGSHIQLDADSINFTADDYAVIADNINMDGYVTFEHLADDGQTEINGGNITTGKIDTERLNVAEVISVGEDQITTITEDTISTTNIVAENLKVKAANIKDQLTAGQINANGIQASDVDISGKITATEGTIGGWQINSDSLTSEDNSVGLFPDPSNDTNCIIWAGNSEQTNAPFQVFKDGTVKIHKGGLQITADGKFVNTLFTSSKDYHYNDIDHENLKYYRYSGTYYGAEGLIGTGYIHRQYAEIGASVTDLINYPDPNTRSTLGIAIADSYKHTSSIVNSYTKFTQINPGVVYIGAYERAFELDDRGNLTSTKLSLDGLTSTSNKFTITTNKLAITSGDTTIASSDKFEITSDEIAITATNGQLKGVWTLGNDSKVSSIPTIRYNTAAQNYGDGGAKDLTTAGNNNDERHPKLCACMVYLNSGKNATITIDDCTSQVVSAMVCEHNAVSDSTINNHKVDWTGKTVTVYNAASGSRRLVLWVLYI